MLRTDSPADRTLQALSLLLVTPLAMAAAVWPAVAFAQAGDASVGNDAAARETAADDDSSGQPPMVLTVVDADGQPIEGAAVVVGPRSSYHEPYQRASSLAPKAATEHRLFSQRADDTDASGRTEIHDERAERNDLYIDAGPRGRALLMQVEADAHRTIVLVPGRPLQITLENIPEEAGSIVLEEEFPSDYRLPTFRH